MRKKSGFTTYELMVSIAIMAVIAAITMPPYLKWWRTSRLQSAVSSFTVDLEMAKTEAIRENDFVVIEFYSGSYKIFVDSDDDWGSSGEISCSIGFCRPVSASMPLISTFRGLSMIKSDLTAEGFRQILLRRKQ